MIATLCVQCKYLPGSTGEQNTEYIMYLTILLLLLVKLGQIVKP